MIDKNKLDACSGPHARSGRAARCGHSPLHIVLSAPALEVLPTRIDRLLALNLERAARRGGAAPVTAADKSDEAYKGITMTTDPQPDPLLDSARKECAKRWLHADLHGYPALSA